MVERRTGPTPAVRFAPGCYRIPDGDVVPHRPQPKALTPTADEILAGVVGTPQSRPAPTRYEWRVFWLTLAVVALGVLIGVLR